MSELKCVIDTGYENDVALLDVHDRFASIVEISGATVIGDRSREFTPDATSEALYERDRLEMIAEQAGMMALYLNGQPPRNRIAVAAGFAAARGIPIFGLRTESQASTGENGIPFNLMINAAIAYSRDETFGYDGKVEIAQTFSELTKHITDAHDNSGTIARRSVPVSEDLGGAYVANPYGFALSTKGFYNRTLLPAVKSKIDYIDPWTVAEKEIGIALAADPEKQATAWTMIGISHIERIRKARMYIGCFDQEPVDVGSLVELGVAAGFGKPVVIYRNDLRTITEGPSAFDASIQAAANLWLPRSAAIAKHDSFPTEIDQLTEELQEVVAKL